MNGKQEQVMSVINRNEQDLTFIISCKSRYKERDRNMQKINLVHACSIADAAEKKLECLSLSSFSGWSYGCK
jgi:hypothetical protein